MNGQNPSPRWKRPGVPALAALALLGAALAGPLPAPAVSVLVVDMIPQAQSSETNQDSEPSIAVNPANPKEIAGSAFTPNPMPPGPMELPMAPIFTSTDGGHSWYLNAIVPGNIDLKTADITPRFSGSGNRFYVGIIQSLGFLKILRTADFTQNVPMTKLVERSEDDQPWVAAATVIAGDASGKDRVYVGHNDHNGLDGHTASIDLSPDGAAAVPPSPANFTTLRLEDRGEYGDDLAPVRISVHPDGTVYAIYYSLHESANGNEQTLDAVVARDDNGGVGPKPFKALADGDGHAGRILAHDLIVPVDAFTPKLGSERLGGGGISIAVDPQDSNRVYAVYSDEPTGSLPYVLHLRRSDDRGVNWTADLLKVNNAINPTVAVNVLGKVGILYQQLTADKHWETHLRRSGSKGQAWDDMLLARFPDGNPAGYPPYLGDYAHLQAVGKSFYGAFSSGNRPSLDNFPSGVTFNRNVDWNQHTLRNLANTGTVSLSIDPFFFVVSDQDAGDDFYVRDWTDGPASGDNGVEPSTHPAFYKTSDVWNRRSVDPGAFPNDQPDNEKAGNGAGAVGDNWAFARIRRNVTGSAQTVTAHFMAAKFGVGSNFLDLSYSQPTVTFAANEKGPKTTPPLPWHLDAAGSTHVCLAVETSTDDDLFSLPTLLGSAPGWPTDLRVLADNNKAQRNMFLSNVPAGAPAGKKMTTYAIVHNAATFPRDIKLQVAMGDPRRFAGATAQVVASALGPSPAAEPQRLGDLGEGGSFTVAALQPGESRWLRIDLPSPAGKEGEEAAVDFEDVVDGMRLDGFAAGTRIVSMEKAVAGVLESQRSQHARLAAIYGGEKAETEARAAQEALDRGAFAGDDYLRFLGDHLGSMARALDELGRDLDRDPFDVRTELDGLRRLVEERALAEALVLAHASYLEGLDALQTLRQVEKGDPADIFQNVRWQRDLFLRAGRLAALREAASVVDVSRTFLAGAAERRLDSSDYPGHLRDLSDALRRVAGALEPDLPGLTALQQAIEAAVAGGDLAAMQKAHRDFLAQLQRLDSRL